MARPRFGWVEHDSRHRRRRGRTPRGAALESAPRPRGSCPTIPASPGRGPPPAASVVCSASVRGAHSNGAAPFAPIPLTHCCQKR